jgi:hypothetical protein
MLSKSGDISFSFDEDEVELYLFLKSTAEKLVTVFIVSSLAFMFDFFRTAEL